jgi:hypothetical protein
MAGVLTPAQLATPLSSAQLARLQVSYAPLVRLLIFPLPPPLPSTASSTAVNGVVTAAGGRRTAALAAAVVTGGGGRAIVRPALGQRQS